MGATTTVELTTSPVRTVYTCDNGEKILHVYANQFQNVNVTGEGLTYGLTLKLTEDLQSIAYLHGADYIAIQVGGETGQFDFENAVTFDVMGADENFKLLNANGDDISECWVSSRYMVSNVGLKYASGNLLWVAVPEPATATLSLLALAALCARRRRI